MSQWHCAEIGNPLPEMREYVSVVRALLSGRSATEGTRLAFAVRLRGVRFATRHSDLSGGAEPGMLRLAAEVADEIVPWACPVERYP